MDESIDERLDKLLRDFRKLVSPCNPNHRRIILTGQEIRTWLADEPNFNKPIVKRPSADSYHTYSSDEDLTEPETT